MLNWQGLCVETFQVKLGRLTKKESRIQNLASIFETKIKSQTFEITEKLDGTSCTFFLDKDEIFHVCSRNIDLKESETNLYWIVARKNQIEEKMRHADMVGMAIQGEIIGAGIQGNSYKLQEPTFFVFDMYDSLLAACSGEESAYCPAHYRKEIADAMGLQHVPIAGFFKVNADSTLKDLITDADGPSAFNAVPREGLVFKSKETPVSHLN